MKQQVLFPERDTAPRSFDLTRYDRFPELRDAERAELNRLFSGGNAQIHKRSRRVLCRLLEPVQDVLTRLSAPESTTRATCRLMCLEMHHRGTPFWVWSVEEWRDIMDLDHIASAEQYGCTRTNSRSLCARAYVPALIYFLLPSLNMTSLLDGLLLYTLTQKIFGKAVITQTMQQIITVLEGWGYHLQTDRRNLTACVCYLLLVNRSPRLEDLSSEFLELTDKTCTIASVKHNIWKVSRVLYGLGLITRPLSRQEVKKDERQTAESIAEEWLAWCKRWRKHSTHQQVSSTYYMLLKVGRWLNAHHPDITSPEQWTYELAAEFVAAVNAMKVGEWAPHANLMAGERLGQPLRPQTKAQLLNVMRTFLRDCQEWQWIPVRLNPHRALRTPPAIRNQVGPNPRVIDKEQWAKLLWAAMNLQAEDLPPVRGEALPYPLAMVRAVAVVWCFAALRSDEIIRLRVGCVRWQDEDVMVPETREILPRDAICFLDIPVNKTMVAYTKAVHPLVGKRINEWERVRPKEQPRHVDGKTSELVEFLFSYRGMRLSKAYINTSLIPHLCRKAGIPEHDSRGPITSHRARASIASQLYNAKEPLTLFELKEYLGHKSLSSTQFYARVDPTKLASQVVKAGYLEQNMATIEVLFDQDAVRNGTAAHGEAWKYYDLGHGYCTNDFWAQCKHRMACARCPFYRPKNTSIEQFVEGKANLVRMLEFVKLTKDEKLLVTEGIELHQALIEKLANVPTPAGPTPRELQINQQEETKVIPLKTVRRIKRRDQNV